jgi:hypothetical protein
MKVETIVLNVYDSKNSSRDKNSWCDNLMQLLVIWP